LVKGKISPETFEEWNRAAGKAELPERLDPKARAKPKRRAKSKRAATRKVKSKGAPKRKVKTKPH
jgi:macrodomain Ter protein organizer (MatP/YcbG family)